MGMTLRILVTLMAFTVCQGCHLHGVCRKKRDLNSIGTGKFSRSIHGGCAARLLSTESEFERTLEKYGLRDNIINFQLAKCVSNKVMPGYAPKRDFVPVNRQTIIHYYFMYIWFHHNNDCSAHQKQCIALKDCILDLARRTFWMSHGTIYSGKR